MVISFLYAATMSAERITENLYRLEPGPIDVHTHPRAFDVITSDRFNELNDGREGKAGLAAYTEVALQGGITAMVMMPNELLRRLAPNPQTLERTELVPYPLSSNDKILAVQSLISHEAVIPVGIHFGIDPSEIFYDPEENEPFLNHELLKYRFQQIGDEVVGLKLYGDETTGGYNVHPRYLPKIIQHWYEYHPNKPVTLHLEDENVGKVLADIYRLPNGKEIPIHIAHVSSRQELEAIIAAKEAGMNLSCEVTVHHLFLDSSVVSEIGGYGCMKPTLKTQADIDFLWANMKFIDIIASDCAPHRRSDKEAENPTYGVTIHDSMLSLLFGAVGAGMLTIDELYDELCIKPRQRFNLPIKDNSSIEYRIFLPAELEVMHYTDRYGFNPFQQLQRRARSFGQVVNAQAGVSTLEAPRASYTHTMRPQQSRAMSFQLKKLYPRPVEGARLSKVFQK
jgi:hypothetical protein